MKDQDAALAFWTEKVGFETRVDLEMGGGLRWIEIAPPGAESVVVLMPLAWAERGEQDYGIFSRIGFACDNVAESYRQLSDRGVEFTQPPTDQQAGGNYATFKDVDGNTFALILG